MGEIRNIVVVWDIFWLPLLYSGKSGNLGSNSDQCSVFFGNGVDDVVADLEGRLAFSGECFCCSRNLQSCDGGRPEALVASVVSRDEKSSSFLPSFFSIRAFGYGFFPYGYGTIRFCFCWVHVSLDKPQLQVEDSP